MLKPLTILISGGLNISSSQSRPQPPDNRTLQNFVKDYVDEYVGGYAVASLAAVLFGSFIAVSN